MKNKILLFASLMLTLASCSKNDDPVVVPPTSTPVDTSGDNVVTTYANLTAMNSWIFDTSKIVSPSTTAELRTETLFVGLDYINNGFTYKTMTTPNATANGYYCNQLKDNKLRIDGSSLKMSGSFKFNIGTNNFEFPVTDFVIFKENAVSGTNCGTPASNTIASPVTLGTATYVVNVAYTVTAVAGDYYASKTFGTKTYNDVKKVTITIAIDATTVLPAPIGLTPVLSSRPQDVIVSEQYYAKGFGMVDAKTIVSYTFSPFIQSQLPATIAPSGLQTITDRL